MVCGSPTFEWAGMFLLLFITCYCRANVLPGTEDDKGIYYEIYPLRELAASSSSSIENVTSTLELRENVFQLNCTAATIQDFPPDMFSQELRRQGTIY